MYRLNVERLHLRCCRRNSTHFSASVNKLQLQFKLVASFIHYMIPRITTYYVWSGDIIRRQCHLPVFVQQIQTYYNWENGAIHIWQHANQLIKQPGFVRRLYMVYLYLPAFFQRKVVSVCLIPVTFKSKKLNLHAVNLITVVQKLTNFRRCSNSSGTYRLHFATFRTTKWRHLKLRSPKLAGKTALNKSMEQIICWLCGC